MDKSDTARAYRNTSYCVDCPTGSFGIRIDETCAALDALLREHGVTTWAYVTACNPQSQPLPPAENAARHAQLVAHVNSVGLMMFTGRGQPDLGDWVAEESLLILGLEEAAAVALGAAFGQNAVVVGRAGGVAQLRWCV